MLDKCLKRYTDGERLWLWRRCAGHSQATAASILGVCRTTLWQAEANGTGAVAAPPRRKWPCDPRLPELLALARRRAGWGAEGTAKRVGGSRITLALWEKQGDRRLREFWERRGFTFV